VDKTANLHVQVGKSIFTQEHLVENASAAVSAVLKAKPDTLRGTFVLSASVSATMSPSVKLDVKELAKLA
jgi:large subunit ribosomal protein L1